jgi:hypothetical protein
MSELLVVVAVEQVETLRLVDPARAGEGGWRQEELRKTAPGPPSWVPTGGQRADTRRREVARRVSTPAGGACGAEGGRAGRRALLAREVADFGEANHHEVQRAEVGLHVRRQLVVDHPTLRPLPLFSSELAHALGLRQARRRHRLASGRARLCDGL